MLTLPTNTPLTIDPKGRLTLPARLFGKLQAERVASLVWVPFDNHLRAYTPHDWIHRVEAPLLGEDSFDPVVADRQRRRLGLACELDVDTHGRVVIPPELRRPAGLVRECVLTSLMDRIEIWDADRWTTWRDGA